MLHIGSVSSNDSGHGSSYAQHDTSSSSSVYTAADCRLLQQISNTAATRNINTQCNTRALSPQLHNLQQQQPATPPPPATTMNAPPLPPSSTQHQQQQQPPLTPTPPPYLMRGQNIPMFPTNVGGSGSIIGSGNISPHPPPLPPQHMNRPLSPSSGLQPSMPPPYATAAAMLHHNHRHSNMHGKFVCFFCVGRVKGKKMERYWENLRFTN